MGGWVGIGGLAVTGARVFGSSLVCSKLLKDVFTRYFTAIVARSPPLLEKSCKSLNDLVPKSSAYLNENVCKDNLVMRDFVNSTDVSNELPKAYGAFQVHRQSCVYFLQHFAIKFTDKFQCEHVQLKDACEQWALAESNALTCFAVRAAANVVYNHRDSPDLAKIIQDLEASLADQRIHPLPGALRKVIDELKETLPAAPAGSSSRGRGKRGGAQAASTTRGAKRSSEEPSITMDMSKPMTKHQRQRR
jgi:hypothetical protein